MNLTHSGMRDCTSEAAQTLINKPSFYFFIIFIFLIEKKNLSFDEFGEI